MQGLANSALTYRNLEHMTDAFIEVTADTLEKAFETSGAAVVDAILDIRAVEKKSERAMEVRAEDLNDLLYNWLEEVIILTITDGFAGSSFEVNITKNGEYLLRARILGEEVDFERHHFKMEVKAPTKHLMEIRQENPVVMRFLLDL